MFVLSRLIDARECLVLDTETRTTQHAQVLGWSTIACVDYLRVRVNGQPILVRS